MKRKPTYEQELALARGREVARSNQRRRVAARVQREAEDNAAREAEEKQRARERELRCGFEVGDRVTGRDYIWNAQRSGVVVEGDLTDGVPVLCDDQEVRVLYRRSLEANDNGRS